MTIKAPFSPNYGTGVVVTPAAASANVLLGKGAKQMCFTNMGTNVCYVRVVSTSAGVATTADYCVPPNNSQVVISKFEDYAYFAHISAAGTTLHVIPGEGF